MVLSDGRTIHVSYVWSVHRTGPHTEAEHGADCAHGHCVSTVVGASPPVLVETHPSTHMNLCIVYEVSSALPSDPCPQPLVAAKGKGGEMYVKHIHTQ